ncbi:hypothetical protein DL546_002309 [Coniochaeta pulveracea]|uniref:LPXTG-domain-containing protein n=1 Tax=Coniochaeta pulveracea TaxID=177199 RepID=A0A420Y3J0_9PEZI|nr:hypothetical protein DL546_002309 [Coniochaeta pulveracea]
MLARTPLDTPRALLSVSILILSSATSALQVVPGSPCFSQCTIDGAPTTNASEIVCSDVEFNSTATGLKFKQCTECLQGSRQFAGVDTDVARYLYNLRYATDVCLFGFPEAHDKKISACATDYVCNPLKAALEVDRLSTVNSSEYGYCTADNSAFRGQGRTTCMGCLDASPNSRYLSNFLVALEAGCEQQPVPGVPLGLSGSLFSDAGVNIANITTAASNQGSTPSHLSTGAIVGIVVGVGALFLAGISLLILYYCRQKRYNKEDRRRRASYASYLHSSPYSPYSPYKFCGMNAAGDGPNYTMDYKSPPGAQPQEREMTNRDDDLFGEADRAYTYKPPIQEQKPNHSRQYSQDEMHESPSAMPTHPAYIPRAVMRRNSPSLASNSQFPSTHPSRAPSVDSTSTFKLAAPPAVRQHSKARVLDLDHGSGGESSSSNDNTKRPQVQEPPLEDNIHHAAIQQLQHYGISATDQQRQPQGSQHNPRTIQLNALHPPSSHERSSSITSTTLPTAGSQPPRPSSRSRPNLPNLILPNPNTSTKRRPPPTTKPSSSQPNPLPGFESIAISGPLAFPYQSQSQQQPQPPGSGGLKTGSSTHSSGSADKRTFRERRSSGGGNAGIGVVGPGAARFAAFQDHIVEQNFIRKGWVEEVPLQSAKDDLW